jgi:glycosyltransferase involved in cell wall biosynthesis
MDWLRSEVMRYGLPTEALELRLGGYSRKEAPQILGAGDILLHPAYMDPCPNLVVEAMACGLPVVHSMSGGVPELVGIDAGIGVSVPEDWHTAHMPDPEALARAVLQVMDEFEVRSDAARTRCVKNFGIDEFINVHGQIFRRVIA